MSVKRYNPFVIRPGAVQLRSCYLEMDNITGPAAPADDKVRLYGVNNAGKDRYEARFATGAVQPIATEP